VSGNSESKIQEIIQETKSFNRDDVLVNLTSELEAGSGLEFVLPLSKELKKEIDKAKAYYRDSGSRVLCKTSGLLEWEYKGKTCLSPLLLYPLDFTLDKIKKEYCFKTEEALFIINPFLQDVFLDLFDISLFEIDFRMVDFDTLQEEWREKGLDVQILNRSYLGNFHHHRFDIVRDLEALKKSNNLGSNVVQLLNTSSSSDYESLPLSARQVYPSDNDQLQVYRELIDKNIVVHGPPGTGKSQVLTNLISKVLFGGSSAIVVSEKRAALEVLEKKLNKYDLGRFLFFPQHLNESKSVINQLKETWQWMEEHQPLKSLHLDLSSQLMDALQFKLNVLTREELIGGVSYSKFQEILGGRSLERVNFEGNTASVSEFITKKEAIEHVYENGLKSLLAILPKHLIDKSTIYTLDGKIKLLVARWQHLRKRFDFQTKEEVAQHMKLASFSQMMANEQHQAYFKALNPTGNELNRFNRFYKNLKRVKKELELYNEQERNWKVTPSIEEAEGLLEKMKDDSFFVKYRIKRRMNMLLKSNFISYEEALKKWVKFQELLKKKVQLEKSLMLMGISTESEMDWINVLQIKLNEEDYKVWKRTSLTKNTELASWNADLHIFYQNLKTFLTLKDSDDIQKAFNVFEEKFPVLLEQSKSIVNFSDLLYKHIGHTEEMSTLELEILKSNRLRFISQFPAFSNFEMKNLQADINEIISLQNAEGEEFAVKIKNRIHQKFELYQKLIQTGTKKLTKTQRELKTRLKEGRSILIKEFGKQQAHPTLRELLASDAKEWIKVLMPVWMLNPNQVARYFNDEKDQFDFALFDESSQMPLANALGTVHRAKRILVAGDEQQMTPHNYFKQGESEPIDLLHQAQFTWRKVMLKHHYRSEHPDLIRFSNKHFYNDQLIAFPAAEQKERALFLYPVEGAHFIERVNKKEAEKVVETLTEVLKKEGTIGVVAFSEKQLSCIENTIQGDLLDLVETRMDEGRLFFKSLENVQGDECDYLLISTGYGPNEEGKIVLNFGPLNRSGGDKRLNVLFTRAKKEIHFVSSLKSEDLALSQNDAINLLRQYIRRLETLSGTAILEFPHDLPVQYLESVDGHQKVKINQIFKQNLEANELVTLQRVLTERNWEIIYG
jgi:superfamily I DNA and/or RNA helicase